MATHFVYSADDVLDVMPKFAVNNNNTIKSLITRYFHLQQSSSVKLVELGAGRGEFINRFRNRPDIETFATDLDEEYYQRLSQKHAAYRTLDELPQPVNYIFAIDVLEYIEDVVAILKQMYQSLLSGGTILIYFPIRMKLHFAFDKQIGHFRHYISAELKKKTLSAGLLTDKLCYRDFLIYCAAYCHKLFFKEGDSLNAKAIAAYDTYLIPVSSMIEKLLFKPFIGKDLLFVASK